MEDGRNRAESLIEVEQRIKRFGFRIRSDIEAVDRLEANMLNQLKDFENLEQRFLLMEKNLHLEQTTISVVEGREKIATYSAIESSSSVEQKEEAEDEAEDESVEVLCPSTPLSSDAEKISKLSRELLERQAEWKREKEELLQTQKQLEEEMRSLRSRLRTGKPRDRTKKGEAAKGSATSKVLDKTLFPVVVQCFVALREASYKRRIETSCLLIQRIFRGYIVRKRTQLTTHRRKVSVHRRAVDEGGSADSVFFVSDDNRSTAAAATVPDPTTGEYHSPALASSSSSPSLAAAAAAAAAAEDDDNNNNNNKANDGEGSSSGGGRSVGGDGNRPKPRKGSLPITTKAKASAASSSSSAFFSSSSSSSSSSTSHANKRSWSLSGTTEWQDPTDIVIHGIRELKQLELFFAAKIAKLNDGSAAGRGRSSVYDVVFAEALHEFHSYLAVQLSLATQEESVNYGYKDLMVSFDRMLRARAKLQLEKSSDDDDFPHPMFVNAFRGFIDEFLTKKHNRKLLPDIKTKKDQRKTNKSKRNSVNSVVVVGDGGGRVEALPGAAAGLSQLASSELLVFVDPLTAAIESKGLSVVGLYRVAGSAGKIKQLIKDMTAAAAAAAGSSSSLDLGARDLHAMTSVLKTIFREMPQPLIPHDVYEVFIQQLPDEEGRSESLDVAISKLPEPNRRLLNRLITHLAKVAEHESTNRMSANALAIVFAPSLLRLSDVRSTCGLQDSLNHIQKQTACLQIIIESQLQKMKNDSDNLKSSADTEVLDTDTAEVLDTDTAEVLDTDTVMLDNSATEPKVTAVSVTGNDAPHDTDNITITSRMSDADMTVNDSVNDIESSGSDENVRGDSGVNKVDNEVSTANDSATDSANDSASSNETDTVSVMQQLPVVQKPVTKSRSSVVNASSVEDEQKTGTDDDAESLSTASDDLDRDLNVSICSAEDGDDDLELKITA